MAAPSDRSSAREDDESGGPRSRSTAPWEFRGDDLSRLRALSDGIFAFAMTLLVLSLALPLGTTGSAAGAYLLSWSFLRPLYAYVISFFVISLWWQAHHLVFTYVERYDRNLFRLNTAFLVFIAIVPFATGILTSAGTSPVGAGFFALLQIGSGIALGGLWLYAAGRGRLIVARMPSTWAHYITIHTFAAPVVFAISIPVAFVDTNAAEVLWLALFAIPFVVRRRRRAQEPGPDLPFGE